MLILKILLLMKTGTVMLHAISLHRYALMNWIVYPNQFARYHSIMGIWSVTCSVKIMLYFIELCDLLFECVHLLESYIWIVVLHSWN